MKGKKSKKGNLLLTHMVDKHKQVVVGEAMALVLELHYRMMKHPAAPLLVLLDKDFHLVFFLEFNLYK